MMLGGQHVENYDVAIPLNLLMKHTDRWRTYLNEEVRNVYVIRSMHTVSFKINVET
jgi:hypothetical protein